MKRLIIIIALLFTTSAHADKIEIKGYKTGGEWTDPINSFNHWSRTGPYGDKIDLTIAGHDVDYLRITPDINKKRVAKIYFDLDSDAYDDVKRAIQTKYRLTCDTSTGQNLAGATFGNEECWYSSNGDTMNIEKYAGNIRTMRLFIYNDSDLNEIHKAKQAKKDSDI